MIRLRIDVDYPYPSRIKSFICTGLDIRLSKNYLKNSKIVARMINESVEDVIATWFFTPMTIPDKEMLKLLNNDRHEIALHVAVDPIEELKRLEEITGRKIRYYTVHGTASLLARVIWKRWRSREPNLSAQFPLFDFKKLPLRGYGLDIMCYNNAPSHVIEQVKEDVKQDYVFHIHPEWLLKRGRINRRGAFYEVLREILNVDEELTTLSIRRRLFFKIAKDVKEYERDVVPTKNLIEKLKEREVDMFTFLERKWCLPIQNLSRSWIKANDNIALLHLVDYEEWWKKIGKKTRNMIRKAEKNGIRTEIVQANEKLAEGIWKIYNETPIRQERGFSHYGIPLGVVVESLLALRNYSYIGAFLQNKLVGFVQLVHGNNITMISQILSLQKHWDKAVNNALVAKTVELCASKGEKWIMYGRVGNHPSLDRFKENNGFTQFLLTRYYIPLTKKGRIAAKLGLHREMKDILPQSVKRPLFPLYNWVSRTKMRVRLLSMSKKPS